MYSRGKERHAEVTSPRGEGNTMEYSQADGQEKWKTELAKVEIEIERGESKGRRNKCPDNAITCRKFSQHMVTAILVSAGLAATRFSSDLLL